MDREGEKIHALSTETHLNMGQDNNSLPDNIHNMVSGVLHQQIGKEEKYIHFQQKRKLKTGKDTTYNLRMYMIR